MSAPSVPLALALGLALGVRHAVDPDHPAAVRVLSRSDRRSGRFVVSTLAFSRDGSRLVSGARDGRIFVWDPREPRRPKAEDAIDGEITGLVWLAGDRALVASSSDGGLARVDAK